MTILINDIKFATRQLRNSPGFTVATALILALGIGGVTAMFSTLYTVLIKPLPYTNPEELVLVRTTFDGFPNSWSAALDYFDFRERNQSFTSLEAYFTNPREATVTTPRGAEREDFAVVSPGLFPCLGVTMYLGQPFTDTADSNEPLNEIIVDYTYWQQKLEGQKKAIGQPLIINGNAQILVGVLPPDFDFVQEASLWLPMRPRTVTNELRRFHNWHILGRLQSGVTLTQAQSDLDVIAAQLAQAYPDSNGRKGVLLTPLQSAYAEQHRLRYGILLACAGAILLLACANAAGLLLARGARRQGEMAVRSALGAGYWSLMSPLLTEAMLLAALGGAVGIFLAYGLQGCLLRLMPIETLFMNNVGISLPVLLFVLVITGLTGLAFGLLPAWRTRRLDVVQDLRSHQRGRVLHDTRLRGVLVVGQVTLTFTLLVVAGLLLRSFAHLHQSDPGFNTQNLLTVEIPLPGQAYKPNERVAFFDKLLLETRSLPGVVSATANSQLPLRNPYNNIDIYAAESPPEDLSDSPTGYQRVILPGYFEAMGIPLLAGRDLRLTDKRGSERVVVISQTLAERLFPDRNPLGQSVTINRNADTPWRIVGIVGDVKDNSLYDSAQDRGTFYRCYAQISPPVMRLAIRTAGSPLAVVPTLRRLLQNLDPRIPLSGPRTMAQIVTQSTGDYRTVTLFLIIFAALAMVLAAVGLYGLLAYLVTQRKSDIGIRLALGAEPATILAGILRSGVKLIVIGLSLGLVGAFALTRLLNSILFGVRPTDPLTFVSVALLLGLVACIACALPAWRAARIDPMEALRYE